MNNLLDHTPISWRKYAVNLEMSRVSYLFESWTSSWSNNGSLTKPNPGLYKYCHHGALVAHHHPPHFHGLANAIFTLDIEFVSRKARTHSMCKNISFLPEERHPSER